MQYNNLCTTIRLELQLGRVTDPSGESETTQHDTELVFTKYNEQPFNMRFFFSIRQLVWLEVAGHVGIVTIYRRTLVIRLVFFYYY